MTVTGVVWSGTSEVATLPGEDEGQVQQDIAVTISNLDQAEVLGWLAALAALSLRKAGIVTFYVDETGAVQFANPTGVYLDLNKMRAPNKPYRFVRPILTNQQPRFVAFKEDGTLWEIEFVEEHEGERR